MSPSSRNTSSTLTSKTLAIRSASGREGALTSALVQQAARDYFDMENHVRVTLRPE